MFAENELEMMKNSMARDFRFKFVSFDDVDIVEEGHTFVESHYCDSEMSDMYEKRTVIALSRERVNPHIQLNENQRKILIGKGNSKEYSLEGKNLSSMLKEMLNLLDEEFLIIMPDRLKSFVKKYGYLHKPIEKTLHQYTNRGFTCNFYIVELGYDSLETWQLFVREIIHFLKYWNNPSADINFYENEGDDEKFKGWVLQSNLDFIQNNIASPEFRYNVSQMMNKQYLINKIFLSKMIESRIGDSQFHESLYVLPSSGQILSHKIPIDLYSFIWLWIEQSVLDDKDDKSIHKCSLCNEYDMLMNLRKSRERDPITLENVLYHEYCYRRQKKRETTARKAKAEGRPPQIRLESRKNGVL